MQQKNLRKHRTSLFKCTTQRWHKNKGFSASLAMLKACLKSKIVMSLFLAHQSSLLEGTKILCSQWIASCSSSHVFIFSTSRFFRLSSLLKNEWILVNRKFIILLSYQFCREITATCHSQSNLFLTLSI